MKTTRHGLLLVLGLCVVSLAADAGFGDTPRRRAAGFVTETLNRIADDRFLWSYRFSENYCRLSVLREDGQGGNRLRMWAPLREVEVAVDASGSVELYCLSTKCISYRQVIDGRIYENSLNQARVTAASAAYAGSAANGLRELVRLCVDPYGH